MRLTSDGLKWISCTFNADGRVHKAFVRYFVFSLNSRLGLKRSLQSIVHFPVSRPPHRFQPQQVHLTTGPSDPNTCMRLPSPNGSRQPPMFLSTADNCRWLVNAHPGQMPHGPGSLGTISMPCWLDTRTSRGFLVRIVIRCIPGNCLMNYWRRSPALISSQISWCAHLTV